MDNLETSAYPIVDSTDKSSISPGFTKLELAALMIGQGLLANSPDWSEKETSINWVSINSVKYAKAIIEEANK